VSLLCLRVLLHCESVVELVVLPAWSDDIGSGRVGTVPTHLLLLNLIVCLLVGSQQAS